MVALKVAGNLTPVPLVGMPGPARQRAVFWRSAAPKAQREPVREVEQSGNKTGPAHFDAWDRPGAEGALESVCARGTLARDGSLRRPAPPVVWPRAGPVRRRVRRSAPPKPQTCERLGSFCGHGA